ncbi:hypothetical protein [Pelagibius sp.]|uniref:hypothetical protein n=1 Tax=Pelagibius sp. TaxID=1931238 RepID=UPI003BB050E6
MPKPEKLYVFKDLVEMFPVSERTLRRVVAELGFKPPVGRQKLILTEIQVERVREALTWRSPPKKPSAPPKIKLPVSTRMARLRETRAISEEVVRRLKAKSGRD